MQLPGLALSLTNLNCASCSLFTASLSASLSASHTASCSLRMATFSSRLWIAFALSDLSTATEPTPLIAATCTCHSLIHTPPLLIYSFITLIRPFLIPSSTPVPHQYNSAPAECSWPRAAPLEWCSVHAELLVSPLTLLPASPSVPYKSHIQGTESPSQIPPRELQLTRKTGDHIY